MPGPRVVLIGGTSNVGKSTVACAVAASLGFETLSTDGLARHPGRPWRTPEREVPANVVEHYGSLTVDELIRSVLDHYRGMWPSIEQLITTRAAQDGASAGLVMEGSALWPEFVAQLTVPHTAAVWLTADPAVIRARVCQAGGYAEATNTEQHLMDKFLARTERYQTLMVHAVDRLDLDRLHTGHDWSVQKLTAAVLAAVHAPDALERLRDRK